MTLPLVVWLLAVSLVASAIFVAMLVLTEPLKLLFRLTRVRPPEQLMDFIQ